MVTAATQQHYTQFVNALQRNSKQFNHVSELSDYIRKNMATKRIVMLGEATHGTREFYDIRAEISKILIRDHGFTLVASEADYPACAQVNKYIHNTKDDRGVATVLQAFHRWPTWMWANTQWASMVTWMKEYNSDKQRAQQVSCYGLDVYSLFDSMQVVVNELRRIEPELAESIQKRYACFDAYEEGQEQEYARSLMFTEGCRKQVVTALQDTLKLKLDELDTDKVQRVFDIQQNAKIVADAETYYRTMIVSDESSWNVRDEHMMDTLSKLLRYHGEGSKGIVWAHNTHIGDYHATDMKQRGEVNIGGLARQQYGAANVYLLGFSTYMGSVIASNKWGGAISKFGVPPGRVSSLEAAYHDTMQQMKLSGDKQWQMLVDLQHAQLNEMEHNLINNSKIGHRAIGVVYNPLVDRYANYVPSVVGQRYDGMVYVDESRAVEPIEVKVDTTDVAANYPSQIG